MKIHIVLGSPETRAVISTKCKPRRHTGN